jgi:hypothetical protein
MTLNILKWITFSKDTISGIVPVLLVVAITLIKVDGDQPLRSEVQSLASYTRTNAFGPCLYKVSEVQSLASYTRIIELGTRTASLGNVGSLCAKCECISFGHNG